MLVNTMNSYSYYIRYMASGRLYVGNTHGNKRKGSSQSRPGVLPMSRRGVAKLRSRFDAFKSELACVIGHDMIKGHNITPFLMSVRKTMLNVSPNNLDVASPHIPTSILAFRTITILLTGSTHHTTR
ncbi:hypothetical protein K443DRAFT_603165 [Laccaria amethystina LaAM-08-1]|uniref:Uncharacterized protein n=1 Tax=Laccaria amethystina LaAM-08-1 TaxID=1095629 RepID=A0A0C9WQ48_9AGAR|nr:hypothetical protein K443DRAFT_603165 [Laccaria amethystina LaAM-08-1]